MIPRLESVIIGINCVLLSSVPRRHLSMNASLNACGRERCRWYIQLPLRHHPQRRRSGPDRPGASCRRTPGGGVGVGVSSALPFVLLVTAENVDSDPVQFAYAGQRKLGQQLRMQRGRLRRREQEHGLRVRLSSAERVGFGSEDGEPPTRQSVMPRRLPNLICYFFPLMSRAVGGEGGPRGWK